MQEASFSRHAPQLTERNAEAVEVWNLIGSLDWHALPLVLALRPVEDERGLIERLVQIRDGLRA